MKNCPTCGTYVDGDVCPRCNTGKPTHHGKPDFDPEWWRCVNTDTRNARCSKPGALSDSTYGKGPWYCAQHFPGFHKHAGAKTEPPGGWDALHRMYARPIADILPQRQREPGEEG